MRKPLQDVAEQGEAAIATQQRLRAESQQLIADFQQKYVHLRWVIDSIQRQRQPDYHRAMQDAIYALHHCRTTHKASFAVRSVLDGAILWDGTVEEFRLIGHPQAKACYAWRYQEEKRRGYFSLLKTPLVNSPQRAVQLSLAISGWRAAKEMEQSNECCL